MSTRIQQATARLQSLPSIALPTDYPRPSPLRLVEAVQSHDLPLTTSRALLKLALFQEGDEGDVAVSPETQEQPTPFQLLLAAFVLLLHRYTGDTDLLIGSKAPSTPDPLILRISVEPNDPFWSVVRRVQSTERDAEACAVPYEDLLAALRLPSVTPDSPASVFRVRFFDGTDRPPDGFLQSTTLTTDLTLYVTRSAAADSARASLLPQLSLSVAYNSLLFTSARIAHLTAQLSQILVAAASDPLAPVSSISLLTVEQSKVLPDPRADLNWCGWAGAITDIFSRNAASHPEKTCVVQCLPLQGGVQQRVAYTYDQIWRASNILAHCLVQGGVQQEEVVMVYAYRSVELVVAVIAVLKAGATFSVIDPAYPPARQIIYLKVAKPRGLVVLSGAGQIAPQVREYITTELDIRVEVPAVSLTPSTVLGGPGPNSQDILAPFAPRSGENPAITLGPDSIGTLSFTSGSTGVPKGVRGRHFSLTHFFPWMATRFNLSSSSRYTMLSGIAHDPIQRDIFTPLFLGAELWVPTSEDIGTPGRLAEWMRDAGVTVTHLTPAMGQLLSAQASAQIPHLRNAFFVGDILTKKDCLRLQGLAPNVRIVNMYGTTETQRAVSYYEIPARAEHPAALQEMKETIPAGQGMVDVQLLVVNRHNREIKCAVGEVGELYVRSGGLAEGYLDQESTSTKFVQNWFAQGLMFGDSIDGPARRYWKGVRDRMYRTGDLGRYLPSGLVECTGRADDQVKIRGFRIELGEIDTCLAQHPGVRENVTLVRRDKNEEKVLVSYFVPMEGIDEWESEVDAKDEEGAVSFSRRYRRLIRDIREHLRKKLPSYSIPSLFVPLSRMPLNPNGKIDKPALPFPDTAAAAAAASTAAPTDMTPTQKTIHDIWARLLPTPSLPISLEENFFDLGGHSILATRLIFELRKTYAIDVPLGLVFDSPTIAGLAEEVDLLRQVDFGLAKDTAPEVKVPVSGKKPVPAPADEYSKDFDALLPKLKPSYAPLPPDFATKKLTVFLTGATGFLGAFILADLLARPERVAKVICLVRAKDEAAALARLREGSIGRDVWDEKWVTDGRLQVVKGDLAEERFGLSVQVWDSIATQADAVLHNGALVHWVFPYSKLRAANVLSTLTALELASTHKSKALSLVSSTSDIDTEHYVRLSDSLSDGDRTGVPESDDIEGARTGLKTGYGQSKWVAEKLLMEAGKRGLRGHIVRPGYVVGHSTSAVTNTDDFVWRLVKGCIQLGLVPDIHNTINMVPVDHVARITALSAIDVPTNTFPVLHVAAQPAVRFNDLLLGLYHYGYKVQQIEYLVWRRKLEEHVLEVQDNALFPLLHFVVDDLPTSTKAPELSDSNTVALLTRNNSPDSMTVDEALLGKYLAWLVATGFLENPTESGKPLPKLNLPNGQVKAIGRSGM
ncbi:alpha-aminoadipate reductase Lys1p [Dacryopinax primogenitus]|uniref:Alpha-aminoadipate reductase n=1 Tax=Dacryopinax primogenitus (strain DJM 731) TaxID=1858805 RepID=M5G0I0_DACPD|nr:alpha-aminoadipate reductase Lys1p [Dacryopinax primogenitus]EJT99336.1 alpha-aminoadipate reductase Lys1p [Dacryopinax primogenitus]